MSREIQSPRKEYPWKGGSFRSERPRVYGGRWSLSELYGLWGGWSPVLSQISTTLLTHPSFPPPLLTIYTHTRAYHYQWHFQFSRTSKHTKEKRASQRWQNRVRTDHWLSQPESLGNSHQCRGDLVNHPNRMIHAKCFPRWAKNRRRNGTKREGKRLALCLLVKAARSVSRFRRSSRLMVIAVT